MPFHFSDQCPVCNQEHGIAIDFNNLGYHDCPKCGAKDVVDIEWETECDLDPIDEQ